MVTEAPVVGRGINSKQTEVEIKRPPIRKGTKPEKDSRIIINGCSIVLACFLIVFFSIIITQNQYKKQIFQRRIQELKENTSIIKSQSKAKLEKVQQIEKIRVMRLSLHEILIQKDRRVININATPKKSCCDSCELNLQFNNENNSFSWSNINAIEYTLYISFNTLDNQNKCVLTKKGTSILLNFDYRKKICSSLKIDDVIGHDYCLKIKALCKKHEIVSNVKKFSFHTDYTIRCAQ